MKINWNDFVKILGLLETSSEFSYFVSKMDEEPFISSTPEEYNDPTGKTIFYKFFSSGVEIGFRQERLNHIHFFIQPMEGYSSYSGPMPNGIGAEATESQINETLGKPSASGGGKLSPLLGYIYVWIKYDITSYAIRFEFSQEGALRKVSLILR